MLGALPDQNVFSDRIKMLLDVDAPESLLDCAAVFGIHIKPWKLRLDPQSLSGEDGGEDGAAVYDCELRTPNVINNFGPASILTMLD